MYNNLLNNFDDYFPIKFIVHLRKICPLEKNNFYSFK